MTGTEPNQKAAFRLLEPQYCNRRGATASMSDVPNCGPTAGASREPDPIFAAIERHRAALRGWLAANDRFGVLQEMIWRRWEIFGESPDDRTDPPEWIEAN